jgi:hypothetical protein
MDMKKLHNRYSGAGVRQWVLGVAGVAALAGAGSVHAYGPTEKPDIVVYLAGAAQTDKLLFTAVQGLFDPDSSLDYYNATSAGIGTDAATSKGYLHWALYGNVQSTKLGVTGSNAVKVLFVKNSVGGAVGTFPFIQKQSTVKNKAATAGYTSQSFIDLSKAISVAANQWKVDSNSLVSVKQDAGINWGEPAIYQGDNVPTGWAAIVPAQASQITVLPAVNAVIGIVATTSLRNALQDAQYGLTLTSADREKAEYQPSLTRQQLVSLVTGQIGKWSDFVVTSANGSRQSLTDFASADIPPGTTGVIPFNKTVHVVWRNRDAGIRAAFNAIALNQPWAGTSAWKPTEAKDPINGPIAYQEDSSSIEQVLDDLEKGSNNSGKVDHTAWAIGLQSLEKNATGKLGYRFLKVDGVAPTIENVYNGKYPLWSTITLQYLAKGTVGKDGANLLATTKYNTVQNKQRFVQLIRKQLGENVGALASFNAKNATHSFGLSGYLATPELAGAQITGSWDATKPVTLYTYGSPTNHARSPVVYKAIASPTGKDGLVPFNASAAGATTPQSW